MLETLSQLTMREKMRYAVGMQGASSPVKEGDILAGRYQVEKVLGVGGMGVVVAARHTTLGQRVALKFLISSVPSTEELATRFEREARAAALLRSEHVARVIDVGKLETGAPYMVMEFLEGEDLGQLMEKDGPLPIDVAVEYILQACEGLAEAHAAKIVHRDLKPSNLFRAMRPDGSALIKILDFGISKFDDSTSLDVTATSTVLGSPMYMSPEQLESAKSVDARSDIWSLGIVLYQLLVGKAPFEEDTLPRLCVAIANKEPRKLRERLEDAPEGLEVAISNCLRKNADERFQNVAELATALAPFAPDAKAHVDRVNRLLLGRSSVSSPSVPKVSRPSSPSLPEATQTDPFARTKTEFGGSTQDRVQPRRAVPLVLGAVAVIALVAAGIAIGRRSSPKAALSLEPSTTTIQTNPSTAAPTTFTSAAASTATGLPTATASATATQTSPRATASVRPTSKPSATASAPPALSGFSLDRK